VQTTEQPTRTDERPEPEPESKGGAEPKPPTFSWLSVLLAVAGVLLVLLVALALLVVVSLFVVHATGVAARRTGLPELPVTFAFLVLVALVVLVFVGLHIASSVKAAATRIDCAIESEGERLSNEVADLAGSLTEIPTVIVEPRPSRRRR
jgi:hypothetical protein